MYSKGLKCLQCNNVLYRTGAPSLFLAIRFNRCPKCGQDYNFYEIRFGDPGFELVNMRHIRDSGILGIFGKGRWVIEDE
jgi:phage FluMu protein Com